MSGDDRTGVKIWGLRPAEHLRRWVAALSPRRLWKFPAVRTAAGHAARAGALLAALALLHHGVHRYLSTRSALQVSAPLLQWPDDAGAAAAGIDGLLAEVRRPATDDRMIPELAARIQADPWVRRLHRLSRSYPNGLELDVEFRRPYVAVRHGDGYVLLDREGVRLPGRFERPPSRLALPAVTGVMMSPPAPGLPWTSPEIAAAFEMLRLIENSLMQGLPIVTMDISNLDRRLRPAGSEVVLRMSQGWEIHWGAPPSAAAAPWEAPVADKLAALHQALKRRPNSPGGAIYLANPGGAFVVGEEPDAR